MDEEKDIDIKAGGNGLQTKTLSNMIWRFAERCGAQLVNFVVSVILARILGPTAYGTVALITVFTTILQVFVDSGMGNSLIQKKNADQLDFSTVFYFNLLMCTGVYLLLFFAAPLIAAFYGKPELTALTRVLGLVLIIAGLKNIQHAYVSRHLMFRKFFFATLGGTITAAVVGIALALTGFGVWALVVQQVTNTAIDTLVLYFTVRWRPTRQFSFERLKGLFSYGWKILASSLIDTVYNNVRQLIIGKMYSSEDLAFYNQGKKFPYTIVTNINTSIDSVLFPVMSQAQDSHERVRNMVRRAIKTSTFIMAPLMMGLAFTSHSLVLVLLTDKWLPCVPFLRIFCITYMFYPIHTSNLNAIKAMGRSDLFLKLEIIKKIVGITTILITMWFGVLAMAYSLLITSVLGQIINSWPNRKLLNYTYLQQLKDILPGIILAVAMGFCILPLQLLPLPTIIILVLQIVCGVVFYVLLARLFKMESFFYVRDMIKPFIAKMKHKKN